MSIGANAKSAITRAIGLTGYELRKRVHDSDIAQRRNRMLRNRNVDLVVDVGANTGQYGQELRGAGYSGRLLSIEPLSAAFAELQAAAQGDGQWRVLRSAVGAERGEATLNIAGNSFSSSLLPMLAQHAEAAPQSGYVGAETVPVETLDALALDEVERARVPFLKVDTQGYEEAVLDGASKVLAGVVGVELELSLVPLYEGQTLMFELIERMKDSGFRMASLETGFIDPVSGETLQMDGIFFRE